VQAPSFPTRLRSNDLSPVVKAEQTPHVAGVPQMRSASTTDLSSQASRASNLDFAHGEKRRGLVILRADLTSVAAETGTRFAAAFAAT